MTRFDFEAKGLRMNRFLCRVLLLGPCLLGVRVAMAGSDGLAATHQLAAIDQNAADDRPAVILDDVALQGEYASGVSGAWKSTASQMGLQVVALGDGRFSAALLPGGLPGNGWTRAETG